MKIPAGFQEVRTGDAWAFSRPEARPWVAAALGRGCTLHEMAARDPSSLRLQGRGAVFALDSPEGRWVVRRYRRGGAVRTLLGERYLRAGEPRPIRETWASEEVRRRGIPTPRVLAGVVYPGLLFYRADLVTEYVPGSHDLAAVLFGGDGAPEARLHALQETGCLLRRMAAAGVDHPDLNAKNVLLARRDSQLAALLLDLDRVGVRDPPSPSDLRPMLARLLRKLARLGSIPDAAAERAVDQLTQLPISATGTGALMPAVWRMRNFMTPYDACYVALAEELGSTFVTGEHSLALELRKRGKRAHYLGEL